MIRPWTAIIILSVNILLASWSSKTNGSEVKFLTTRPLYVALGRTLVLEAIIQHSPDEKILYVTWERISSAGSVRLAEHPSENSLPRVTIGKDGAEISLSSVQESDYGTYIICITLLNGTQKKAQRDVLKAEKPPDASVILLCAVSGERAHWDSPMVIWLADGVELTNQTANMSERGSKLHLQEVKGSNYTCISDSSQGTSVAYFIIPECPKETRCSGTVTTAMSTETIIVLVILVLTVCFVEEVHQ